MSMAVQARAGHELERGHEPAGEAPGRAPVELTAAERLRLKSDAVAARLAAERAQERPAQLERERALEQERALKQEKSQKLERGHDLEM